MKTQKHEIVKRIRTSVYSAPVRFDNSKNCLGVSEKQLPLPKLDKLISEIIDNTKQQYNIENFSTLFENDFVMIDFAHNLAADICIAIHNIRLEQFEELRALITIKDFFANYILPLGLLIGSLYLGLSVSAATVIALSPYLRNISANILDKSYTLSNYISNNAPKFALVFGLKSYLKQLDVVPADDITNQILNNLNVSRSHALIKDLVNFKDIFLKPFNELSKKNISYFYNLIKDIDKDDTKDSHFGTRECQVLSYKLAEMRNYSYGDNSFNSSQAQHIEKCYNIKNKAKWLIENRDEIIKLYSQQKELITAAVIKDVFSKSEIDNIQTAGKHNPVTTRLAKYTSDGKTHVTLQLVCKAGSHIARLKESRKN